jgi:hypothetical protein
MVSHRRSQTRQFVPNLAAQLQHWHKPVREAGRYDAYQKSDNNKSLTLICYMTYGTGLVEQM